MSDKDVKQETEIVGSPTRRILIRILLIAGIASAMMLAVQENSEIKRRLLPKVAKSVASPRLAIETEADILRIKDPVSLLKSGRHWLSQGDPLLAEKCFTAAIGNEEINRYDRRFASSGFAKARIAELMGRNRLAKKLWRAQFTRDLPSTLFYLTRSSIHPEKKALIAEARAIIKAKVEQVKRGESPDWYVTQKGAVRKLTAISAAQAVEHWRKTDRPLRYVYIDSLDLTNIKSKDRTETSGKVVDAVTKYQGRIRCMRCVIGSFRASSLIFDDPEHEVQFSRTVFVDKADFGKTFVRRKKQEILRERAAEFRRLYLNWSVFLGDANFHSVKVHGKGAKAYLPLTTFFGSIDLRNVQVDGVLEMRYLQSVQTLQMQRAKLHGSAYLGHVRARRANLSHLEVTKHELLLNSVVIEDEFQMENAHLRHGATFEHAQFNGPVTMRNGHVERSTNLSRATFKRLLIFENMSVENLVALGVSFEDTARFNGSVFKGRTAFALDGLTRRDHLEDVTALHTLYKRYQGDEDSDEKLTRTNQYGVLSVNDLITRFKGAAFFTNTSFGRVANFERVTFGSTRDHVTNFYNSHFEGEAHFDHSRFSGAADYRSISANEISFNDTFFEGSLLLDEANVRGRLSMDEMRLADMATWSAHGSNISSFGVSFEQLLRNQSRRWDEKTSKLFYLQCLLSGRENQDFWTDDRLLEAHWDSKNERPITDQESIRDNVERICIARTIGEFTMLRDSFSTRSMREESDWAYWHLKHYRNHQASRYAPNLFYKAGAFINWLLFEKAFGWGVLLQNLIFTLLVTIFIFVGLHYWLCGDMLVRWDGEDIPYRQMPFSAMVALSTSAILVDSGLSASLVPDGKKWWKYLYTAEVAIGIVVITFFIGAYTRLVVAS